MICQIGASCVTRVSWCHKWVQENVLEKLKNAIYEVKKILPISLNERAKIKVNCWKCSIAVKVDHNGQKNNYLFSSISLGEASTRLPRFFFFPSTLLAGAQKSFELVLVLEGGRGIRREIWRISRALLFCSVFHLEFACVHPGETTPFRGGTYFSLTPPFSSS